MKILRASDFSWLILLFIVCSCKTEAEKIAKSPGVAEEARILPPEDLYGDLFYDVQTGRIFEDSKTFVDARPVYEVSYIREAYQSLGDTSQAALASFVNEHFELPEATSKYKSDSSSINMHITKLWDVLKRPADERVTGTLIPLPNPYIVPGGRFREVYYWDSYFTMLGLLEDGEVETIRHMVDNFAFLINEYGFIPNGNRTYYLGRSQPPFFALMVELLASAEGDQVLVDYLPELEKEYEFWMSGKAGLGTQTANKRVVKVNENVYLNRYWDEFATPRPESYREDVETANKAVALYPEKTREQVYRDLRAGAESGWDYSSRWLEESENGEMELSSIQTTDILPVDLNSLLYNLEITISRAAGLAEENSKMREFHEKAIKRKEAILKYFWNDKAGFFLDYNFRRDQFTGKFSLAGLYPLFFEIASKKQAMEVAAKVEEVFLKPGGVVATPYQTGEQWDAPNGWAPLQWITIKGLRNYDHVELADTIQDRWTRLNSQVYDRTYKMLEKYNVEDLSKESGGGEYPTQDGFGWTNGIYKRLTSEENSD
ncbi:alpha,alpha-trehalase TreF [Gramella sp. BOM4]|nr:alpha,alpha-trehalase TreF [Christiangramia bathymodioli]